MNEVLQFRRTQPATSEPDFGSLIKLYLETRDAKTALEKKHKEHLKKYTSVLQKIEGVLMAHLNDKNLQSLSSEIGTAYITHKRSAPIADGVAFRNFVIENRAWEMLDWKANVTAVSDFLGEHQTLPPGVNYRSDVSLSVMRK